MSTAPDTPFRLTADARLVSNAHGAFLMHVSTGQCFVLNALGARICAALKAPMTPADLEAALRADFRDVSAERIAADVRDFISQLNAQQFLLGGDDRKV